MLERVGAEPREADPQAVAGEVDVVELDVLVDEIEAEPIRGPSASGVRTNG